MTKKFTPEEVTKIARLSSLELTEKETDKFAEQFSTILGYFQLLKEVEISDVNCDADPNHLNNVGKIKLLSLLFHQKISAPM